MVRATKQTERPLQAHIKNAKKGPHLNNAAKRSQRGPFILCFNLCFALLYDCNARNVTPPKLRKTFRNSLGFAYGKTLLDYFVPL